MRHPKFEWLNNAIVKLVEDFGLAGFETLAVEDKRRCCRPLIVPVVTLSAAQKEQMIPCGRLPCGRVWGRWIPRMSKKGGST